MDLRKLSLDELDRLTIDEYKQSDKLPIVVILDNIRSAHNVGSFFRTVDGLGLQEIVLCGITAQPPHKEINKSAIGATNSVSWKYSKNTAEVLKELKSEGYELVGIEQTTNSVKLSKTSFNNTSKYALVFGNEVDGISYQALALLDYSVEIQQFGTKHSFNVAVCGGMILWEIAKQFRK